MNEKHRIRFIKEYQAFKEEAGQAPPAWLEKQVKANTHRLLSPPLWSVLGKTCAIYAVVATLILLVCPQFGLTLLVEVGVLHLFSLLGHYGCFAACGALFLGSGALAAGILLTPEELKKLWPLRYMWYVTFSLVAFILLIIFGAEVALGIGTAWILGAIGGEAIGFNIGRKLRYPTLAG